MEHSQTYHTNKKTLEIGNKIFYEFKEFNEKIDLFRRYFLHFSGSLALQHNQEAVFEDFVPLFYTYKDEINTQLFEEMKDKDFEQVRKNLYKKDVALMIKSYKKMETALHNLENYGQIVRIEYSQFKNNYRIKLDPEFLKMQKSNRLFSDDFFETISLIKKILRYFYGKILTLYDFFLEGEKNWRIIISKTYDEELFEGVKNDQNYLTYKVFCDQVAFDKWIALIKDVFQINSKVLHQWILNVKSEEKDLKKIQKS